MSDTSEVSTATLWRAIRRNADLALHHLDWVQYLKNIKVLCEWIEMRVELFQEQRGSGGAASDCSTCFQPKVQGNVEDKARVAPSQTDDRGSTEKGGGNP